MHQFARKILKSETFYASAILLAVLNICFFPCAWGNRTLLASAQDAPSIFPTGAWAGTAVSSKHEISQTLDNRGPAFLGEPWLALAHYQYVHEHVFPLWNPYQVFGHPLAANQESQPAYPLTLAVLLHVAPRSYNCYLHSPLFLADICCYLYLRFFVSFWPAVGGGVSAMLAGYYLLFISMPQLSVEVLVPASLLAAECLVRKTNHISLVGFSVLILLVFLGGMPESALLLLCFLCVYLLFRIVSDPDLRSHIGRLLVRLTTASIAGRQHDIRFPQRQ